MTTSKKKEKAIKAIDKMLDDLIKEAMAGNWRECWNLRWDIIAKVQKLPKLKPKKLSFDTLKPSE